MNQIRVFWAVNLSAAILHIIMVIACQAFFNKKKNDKQAFNGPNGGIIFVHC